MRTVKTITLTFSERGEARRKTVNIFLDELPGKGRGELCSHYVYFVEDEPENHRIFLKRPAILNKGFDFEVHVENMNFGKRRKTTRPSHNYILNDLKEKHKENFYEYNKLEELINKIYQCKDIHKEEIKGIELHTGIEIEIILKIIKWLFVEQDVTYWNWSGRDMFQKKIQEIKKQRRNE